MCAAARSSGSRNREVTVHKLVLASDIGKALNPQQVEAQDEGAAVMGLGHTLMEQLILDDHGRILNLGALDYRIPTIQDVPLELDLDHRERGRPGALRREGRRRRRHARRRGGDRRRHESSGRRRHSRLAADARENLAARRKGKENE